MERTRLSVAALATAVVLVSVFAAVLFPVPARGSDGHVGTSELPPRTGISPVNLSLYGDAGLGWGYGPSNVTEPGPTITVFLGDIVNLTLTATDSNVKHNWFIDYNNDFQPNPGEPISPDFISGSPVAWSFVPDRPGNWTYRCQFHPTSMSGSLVVLGEPRPVNLTLYGNANGGWGFSSTSLREPGPPLVVLWGTNVTLTLIATDTGVSHSWFIDYNNDLMPTSGEPSSPEFSSGNDVVWWFIAQQTGNWTYRCHVHPTSMTGNITIIGGPPPNLPVSGAIPLISTIMYGALGVVAVFAAVYHVRAVRASKRAK